MALKAYKQVTFKANLKFEDDSIVGATFRLPRSIDFFKSAEGNTIKDNLMTFSNICLGLDEPQDVELADGQVIPVKTLAELIELGVPVDISDAMVKWYQVQQKANEAKEKLVKKSKSAGNSTPKGTPETKD